MALLRWITAILVVCAALPASALSAVVDRDTVTGIITISGSSVSSGDEITITTTGTSHVIRDPNGVTAPGTDCLLDPPAQVQHRCRSRSWNGFVHRDREPGANQRGRGRRR